MSKQGIQNKDQTRKQIEKQDKRNDIELGNEFQIDKQVHRAPKKVASSK
ncbi:hypothetical protein [Peribacillus frigoritolerans]